MADGGKTSVTRKFSKSEKSSSRTNFGGRILQDGISNNGAGSGEEQGRGGTVRPRSKSPTKRPTSPPLTSTRGQRATRSPSGTGSGRFPSQTPAAAKPSSNTASAPTTVAMPPPGPLQAPSRPGKLSNSVPATPHVRARRNSNGHHRTPSPIPGSNPADGSLSPRSARSDSDSRARPPQRSFATVVCPYETGLTASRRRIAYAEGGDMLEKELGPVKEGLSREEEKKLTAEMQVLYKDHLLPTAESEQRRASFKAKLESILNQQWPASDIRVHVFGSSGNLLCTSESDVDVCITTPQNVIGRMCNLARCLAKRGMERVVCIPHAKVPIVKIWDPEYQLACDMNINNTAAIENTRMIRTYVMIDPRVRPLAMVLKHWTRRRILNDAGLGGTLSSYTWICLLIHFLQTRDPPVLPSLQQRPHQCTLTIDGKRSSFADDVESLSSFGKNNKETLGELLFGLFRYYAHEIDYENSVISIRTGKLLSKKEKRWHTSTNNRLCVEEPFNTDRNLGNTADDISFRGLHLEIRRAFGLISEVKLERCCEQYEFPQETERVWQRPAPQPLPVLTRSRSQTNRSSRSNDGVGGRNGNKPRHSKAGGSGRRASSAAASNKNNLMMPGHSQHGHWLVESGTTNPGQIIHEQLSQHFTMLQLQQQEAWFKLQQQQMAMAAQTHAQSVAQVPSHQQPSSRHMQSLLRENPRRSSAIESGPLSAPLRGFHSSYAYPFPTTPRSGAATPAIAHAKHTVTNPSSPSLGQGRLAPQDPRRHYQRPNTPEASDMTRSRSQPPVSSRDGNTPSTDQGNGRWMYPAGTSSPLAGYPGLHHYQQQFMQGHGKERHRSSQQHFPVQPHDSIEPARARLNSLRIDGHDSEDRDRDAASHEYVGYFFDQFTPAQLAGFQVQQSMPTISYDQRGDRLNLPENYRLGASDGVRTSRSPSPSSEHLSRDTSRSTQSIQTSRQQAQTAPRAGGIRSSMSSPVIAGGPIIIDGSGDSPSDTQPSQRSRPSSVYEYANSEVITLGHDRQFDPNGAESSPHFGNALRSSSPGHDSDAVDPSTPAGGNSGFHVGHMHFGELPASSSHISYNSSKNQAARSGQYSGFLDDSMASMQSLGTSGVRDKIDSKSVSASGSNKTSNSLLSNDFETAEENGSTAEREADTVLTNVSLISEANGKNELCSETSSQVKADQLSETPSLAPFHQQLPPGMPNGSAIKPNVPNGLKPAPLLSPVREVRTPSPTTSRNDSLVQAQNTTNADAKSRATKDKRSAAHVRAISLLSGETMRAAQENPGMTGKKKSVPSDARAEQVTQRRTQSNVQAEVPGVQSSTHISNPQLPVSYSAIARKSSQPVGDHVPSAQGRQITRNQDSGSISPRTRSPGTSSGSHAEIQGNSSVSVVNKPTVAAEERVGFRSIDNALGIAATESDPPKERQPTAQQRQLRAQQTQALAESVARINLPKAQSSEPNKAPAVSAAATATVRTSPSQRAMSYAQGSQSTGQYVATQVREAPSDARLIGNFASAGNSSSGWQQAVKRRGNKKGNQLTSASSSIHKRQTHSISGAVPPSELSERKGG